MSLDLRERFEQRRARLQQNVAAMQTILERSLPGVPPDATDLPGLAWLLEASYSDIEEVLKGIAQSFGEELKAGSWHRELLDTMSVKTPERAPVIAPQLRGDLDDYRAFRHFSRYSTFQILAWDQMAPLVERLPVVVEQFLADVEAFLSA